MAFVLSKVQRSHRVVFFGNDLFSLATLKALHKEKEMDGGCVSQLAVCCNWPKSGSKFRPIVHEYASKVAIERILWPINDNDLCKLSNYDLGVVASFGHLLPPHVISALNNTMLNVHASLLPRWRGAAPIPHAIMKGDRTTGISIMLIRPHRFDVGPLLASRSYTIDPNALLPKVTADLAELGADLLIEVLRDLEKRTERPQSEHGVTKAPLIRRESFRVCFSKLKAIELYNLYRGLYDLDQKLFGVFGSDNIEVRFDDMVKPDETSLLLEQSSMYHVKHGCLKSEDSGSLVLLKTKQTRKTHLLIRTMEQTWIEFRTLQPKGKRRMSGRDFFNGFISRNRSSNENCLKFL